MVADMLCSIAVISLASAAFSAILQHVYDEWRFEQRRSKH